ncbi:MAG TPA: TIGR03085 family metal-binding protein [Micromonosporaceae bacterium]|jgi:uncharacterized protein (TIGR03085 family)
MSRYAQAERRALADLLLALGPDEPTLCVGWTTRDLAAHLVVRDRRPDAAAGIVVRPLRRWGDRVRDRLARKPYPELVAKVRRAPWWSPVSNSLLDPALNTLEYFVHHEDARRARPGWQPRELSRGHQEALWGQASRRAGLALRRLPANVIIQSPGYGEVHVGAGGPHLRLVGAPGELLMFLTGRQRAARVQIDAPAALADRLRTARLGVR